MAVKNIFVLVSTRTKNKFMQGYLKKHVRTINPETLDYEEEEGILNCFGSLGQAKEVQGKLGKDKHVSVLAFTIPMECILPQVINRKGHSKRHVADCAEQRFGVRNYLAPLGYGEEGSRYLIVGDMASLLKVFDPEGKRKEPVQAVKTAVETKKPGQEVKLIVQETFKDVCPQADTGMTAPAWVIPAVCGMLSGFIAGIMFARTAQEYPFMTAAALSVTAAVLIVVWLYRHSEKAD